MKMYISNRLRIVIVMMMVTFCIAKGQDEIAITIGINNNESSSIRAAAGITVKDAFVMIGQYNDNQYVVLMRNDVLYVLDELTLKKGADDVVLENGDKLFQSDSGDSVITSKVGGKLIISGGEALEKLSTMRSLSEKKHLPVALGTGTTEYEARQKAEQQAEDEAAALIVERPHAMPANAKRKVIQETKPASQSINSTLGFVGVATATLIGTTWLLLRKRQ